MADPQALGDEPVTDVPALQDPQAALEVLREAATGPPRPDRREIPSPIKGKDVRLRKHYQFTAIDDCTRLRVLQIYPRCDQKTAIAFVDYVTERLPFRIDTIQADNGAEFHTQFHWHALDKGFGHAYIKPAIPRLNGKVDGSHRIDQEAFYRLLDGVMIDDANVLNSKLREWDDYYNYDRPHGGLSGCTPYEKLLAVTKT